MVGATRAFFQTERETIEFTRTNSGDCSAISYDILDKSRAMIIRGIVLDDNKCYYQLTDYDNERKYIIYDETKLIEQYSMKGLLKQEGVCPRLRSLPMPVFQTL